MAVMRQGYPEEREARNEESVRILNDGYNPWFGQMVIMASMTSSNFLIYPITTILLFNQLPS
jgi:hypothetical protein